MAAPFPLPAHQTGKICNDDVRMRHVWMPPFAQDVFERLGPRSTPKFPEHIGTAESARAAPLHVVPSNKEVSNAVIDVMVDGPIRLQPRAIAKIRGPTDQKSIQSVAHGRPCAHIAGLENVANLRLDPLNTFLRWGCAKTPMAIFRSSP
jgi:hypothetical protein